MTAGAVRALRLPSLTGVRAAAASLVVAYHVFDLWGSGGGLLMAGPRQWYVAVSTFFVLTGFVLTWGWRGRSPGAFLFARWGASSRSTSCAGSSCW